MTLDQFAHEMDRLKEVFGDRNYPEGRTRLIWREVKDLPASWFEREIDSKIATMRQAPLLGDFTEAIWTQKRALREHAESQPSNFASSAKCSRCQGLGIFIAFHSELHERVGAGPYAFKCGCEFGKNRPGPIPVWDQMSTSDQKKYNILS